MMLKPEYVQGRGDFYASLHVDEIGHVHIRVDDRKNDEFWLNVGFTAKQIQLIAALSKEVSPRPFPQAEFEKLKAELCS